MPIADAVRAHGRCARSAQGDGSIVTQWRSRGRRSRVDDARRERAEGRAARLRHRRQRGGAAADEQADDLAARIGAPLELAGIAVRRPGRGTADVPARRLLTTDADGLVERDDVDVVVEVIGGIEPARSLILAALEAGASVVTANKALLAEDGADAARGGREAGVDLYYEAAVAGAIPLLRPLRESLAGDRVSRVLGIVNGTTNYILTRMDETGAGFAEALAEAQALGYAEADPTADVEGFDAAAKAAILAALAFHTRVTAADVYREGITEVTAADVACAPGDGLRRQAARHLRASSDGRDAASASGCTRR